MKAIWNVVIGVSIVIFNCIVANTLVAQGDPVPKEPLIPRVQDMTAWTITYRYKTADSDPKADARGNTKPPDKITTVQVAKTGKTYHRIVNWSSGGQTDIWTIGPRQLAKDKSTSSYTLMPNEGASAEDYSMSDFEDLAWITMKQYSGYKKGDQPVFVFQAKNTDRPLTRRDRYNLAVLKGLRSTPSISNGTAQSKSSSEEVLLQLFGDTTATVVLDATTQLPVAYDDGKTVCTYQFFTPTADFLVPPPEAANLLRRFDEYIKRTTIRPSSP